MVLEIKKGSQHEGWKGRSDWRKKGSARVGPVSPKPEWNIIVWVYICIWTNAVLPVSMVPISGLLIVRIRDQSPATGRLLYLIVPFSVLFRLSFGSGPEMSTLQICCKHRQFNLADLYREAIPAPWVGAVPDSWPQGRGTSQGRLKQIEIVVRQDGMEHAECSRDGWEQLRSSWEARGRVLIIKIQQRNGSHGEIRIWLLEKFIAIQIHEALLWAYQPNQNF